MLRVRFSLLTVVLVFLGSVPVTAHDEDFEVGIDPQLNQVMIEFDPALFPWPLPVSAWPEVTGFALDDPGFVSLDPDEVVPGVLEQLDPGASIALRVVATSSPAMKVWNPVGPGEPGFQVQGDDLWTIGSPFFDAHPVWHVDTADPAYDPAHSPWAVSFQLVDLAEYHQPSDIVTVLFTPEPGTGAALVLVAAGVFARGRS